LGDGFREGGDEVTENVGGEMIAGCPVRDILFEPALYSCEVLDSPVLASVVGPLKGYERRLTASVVKKFFTHVEDVGERKRLDFREVLARELADLSQSHAIDGDALFEVPLSALLVFGLGRGLEVLNDFGEKFLRVHVCDQVTDYIKSSVDGKSMELDELLEFIALEDKRLNKRYGIDREKMVLARAVKLSEEVGELCEQVLVKAGLQRKEKLEGNSNIEEEFADVVITTLLLAKAMGVDVRTAIKEKIGIINSHYEKA